ncbi:MAG TPA: penicillin-binding protein 2 [Candidatus Omnitrophota bacterium]|nr:penicillin-binding protein 2 [Candidatus Omnitrophota bacterium]HPD84015.1 penicillin-binding protein 2 [Candidatus Omnitrophota bacterium]HRZ02872.1 penicillin-binding protein 2 [Candidatus Omnitrophota bacterium]
MRLKVIRLVILYLFLFITGGLLYLQIIRGNDYFLLSLNNSIRVVPIESRRGIIFDRNGAVLADNRFSFDVAVVPQEAKDKEKLFDYLAQVLKVDKEKLLKTFKRKITASFVPVVVVEDVSREAAIILEENKFRFPGLMVRTDYRRYYPFREISAHVIGYIGKINRSEITQLKEYGYTAQSMIGRSGIERSYDRYLQGQDGGLQVEVNNRGQQVRLLGYKEPVGGQSIGLTIDSRIQQIAMDALQEKRGAVIAMDLETDEVLAMVSYPSFDPNDFVSGQSYKAAGLFHDSSAPLLNRAISGLYPPGSVFKLPIVVAALETGKITPRTSFMCQGFYSLGGRSFGCSHTHGMQDLVQAIAHSCNVYFFNAGLLLGPELISQYARQFGLGSLTGIDLPSEQKGFVPDRLLRKKIKNRQWYKGDTLNFSIGQGDTLVTPIQLLRMMAAIARNSKEVHPHILKTIGSLGVENNSVQEKLEINEKNLETLKLGLREAVQDEEGTARLLAIQGVSVLGKTGTAETSGGRAAHAWFVGFCPLAKTKIVFCVFLEHGGTSYNACAVARQILLKMQEEQIL